LTVPTPEEPQKDPPAQDDPADKPTEEPTEQLTDKPGTEDPKDQSTDSTQPTGQTDEPSDKPADTAPEKQAHSNSEHAQNEKNTPKTGKPEEYIRSFFSAFENPKAVQIHLSLSTQDLLAFVAVFILLTFLLQSFLFCFCISPLRKETQDLQRDVRQVVKKLGKARKQK
jgi:hypothetical protein